MAMTRIGVPQRALTRWQVYGVCLVMFLEGLSSSSINVQVAAVRADLAPGPVGLQLVASTFLVAYAALLLPSGRLADWLDRRHVFLAGLGLFALGSLAGALAPTVWVLVAARLLQGAGAALTAPAALALITAPLPEGAERNRMVALYGALGAVGFSTGLVLPGFLVAQFGWRSSFAVLLPFVALVLLLTWRVPSAPADREGGAANRPDWPGTVALLGLVGGGTWLLGAARDLAPTTTTAAVVLLTCLGIVVLARWRRTVPDGVLRRPARLAMAALAGAFAGVLASIYLLTLALQDWHGLDAFTVGLLILPQPACFALLARCGSAWVNRAGTLPPLVAGMLLIATSIGVLSLAGSGRPPVLLVLLAMAGVGAGLALVYPAASIRAVNSAPERLRGSTAAVLTTAQNIGGSGGLALVTALALVPQPGPAGSLAVPMVVCALMVLAGLAVAGRTLCRRRDPNLPDIVVMRELGL
ncbi:MFS transporter [Ornithinimicrobium cavernae]|uniref:MFS transporter n=1 Tax=Ornithinimicrobium cavernae TaxID=2666047 RepID=UPI000D69528C|nr:MFS transporter [Ornithinimicrobium cavernae]